MFISDINVEIGGVHWWLTGVLSSEYLMCMDIVLQQTRDGCKTPA